MGLSKNKVRENTVADFVAGITNKALALQRLVKAGILTPAKAKRKMKASLAEIRARLAPNEATNLNKALRFIHENRTTKRGVKKILGIVNICHSSEKKQKVSHRTRLKPVRHGLK